MKLKDKTIWITGASSGVGEGMARVFHREGANLIISARRKDELERVRKTCTGPGSIQVLPFDITDEGERAAAAREALATHQHLDALVNNAGIAQRALAQETSLDVDRRVMEVDYFGPIALTKLVLPRMIQQRSGHLLVTSSVAGKHGMGHHSAYCAAKHALHGYYDSLRIELLDYNIQVCLLVIAGVRSNVASHALLGDGSEYGRDDWGANVGMSAESCAEQAMDAMLAGDYEPVISIPEASQAMQIKLQDPVAFTQRMHRMMKWMESQSGKQGSPK